MSQEIDKVTFRAMLNAMADKIVSSKDELNAIDSEIGDADHGTGMAQSFAKAKDKLAAVPEDADIAAMTKAYGSGIMGGGGGASGALFSAVFMEGAKALAGRETLAPLDIAAWWRAGLEKVKDRGKAKVGDKTMVDAMEPAVAALEEFASADLATQAAKAAEAAWRGVESTRNLVAGQGRSRYAGERSIGHQDAGATSVAFLFDVLKASL